MGFLEPFYNGLFWFLPEVLSLLAGTIFMLTLSIMVEVIPMRGGFPLGTILKYVIYALLIANTIFSIFSTVSLQQFTELFFANIMILILMVFGFLFYNKLRTTPKVGWLFGYYGVWLLFFIFMVILTAFPDFNITGETWIMMLPWAFAQIFGVIVVRLYRKQVKTLQSFQNPLGGVHK